MRVKIDVHKFLIELVPALAEKLWLAGCSKNSEAELRELQGRKRKSENVNLILSFHLS
jgi:hypothetical protein